jgi:hypothetical protein
VSSVLKEVDLYRWTWQPPIFSESKAFSSSLPSSAVVDKTTFGGDDVELKRQVDSAEAFDRGKDGAKATTGVLHPKLTNIVVNAACDNFMVVGIENSKSNAYSNYNGSITTSTKGIDDVMECFWR